MSTLMPTAAAGARRADVTWPVDVIPLPQMLLVDFEGGRGSYPIPKPFSSKTTTVQVAYPPASAMSAAT